MKKKKGKMIILGIFLLIIGLYTSIPDGKMRLIFCDVGQGDGAIIVKGNWQVLIDTGADNGKIGRCLDRYIPFWDKKIEGIIISHWDEDHSGALENIIKGYEIGKLFESTESGNQIESGVFTETVKAGDIIEFGEVNFEVVYPNEYKGESNENSLVVVLDYRGRKFMFTGDVDNLGEGEMMSWWQERVEGIKVSHHGSDNGNSEAWLKRLSPATAVISVGKNNYGHPKEIVLERLKNLGVKVLRTDKGGDVILGWN